MQLLVEKGDLIRQDVDAIVNPANSHGTMGGGVGAAIKAAGGSVIEEEAIAEAPIPVGAAVLTTAGRLPARHVIHAPTMTEPTQQIPADNVAVATTAALACAKDNELSTIAFPGMGTGVGGVSPVEAAPAMVAAIKSSPEAAHLTDIRIVCLHDDLYEAFQPWL